jgi:hypothetical protein
MRRANVATWVTYDAWKEPFILGNFLKSALEALDKQARSEGRYIAGGFDIDVKVDHKKTPGKRLRLKPWKRSPARYVITEVTLQISCDTEES